MRLPTVDMMDGEESPALMSLEALLPRGLQSVEDDVLSALKHGDYSRAMKAANATYSATNGTDRVAALTYVLLLLHRDLIDEAKGVLRKALEYHADDVAMQLVQIEMLFATGEFESATALLEALGDVTVNKARHLAYMGDLFWELGRRDDAQRVYELATEQGSRDAEVALRLADIYADKERFWDAAEQFERAGRLTPSDPHIWAAVTEAWLGLGAWDRAADAAQRATKLDALNAETWTMLGAAHRESGDLGRALTAFERARNLDPDDPDHWMNLAGLQLELGLADEARQSYEKVSELRPSSVDALNGMVAAAYDLGDAELAERLAQQALDRAPDNPDALYNYGVVTLSLRRAEQSADAFGRAHELEPDNPHILAGLATAVLLQGEVDRARELVTRAVAIEDEDAELVLEFTQFLFRQGGADVVLEFLEEVECSDPAWQVLRPVFEFVARSLRREEGIASELVRRFVESVQAHPDAIPIVWDFDEIERLGYALDDADRETLLDLLDVVEGRQEVESLDVDAP